MDLEEDYNDAEVRAFIHSSERDALIVEHPEIRFMANCQSGAWAHFSGLRRVAVIDNWSRLFSMAKVLTGCHMNEIFPRALVYASFVDYFDEHWPQSARDELNTDLYERSAAAFCDFLSRGRHHLLVVGAPRGMPSSFFHPHLGITPQRIDLYRATWDRLATKYDFVTVLDVDRLVTPARMLDDTHFRLDASKDVAAAIATWFAGLPDGTAATDLGRRPDQPE